MPNFLSLPLNTKGRDFIVGDIHGAFSTLEKALAQAEFDPAVDRLISVGDLIDRGPEPLRCLEFLKQPWFFAVRGNHEDMFMDICRDGKLNQAAAIGNIRNGMGWALMKDSETLRELEQAFKALPVAMEIASKRGTVGVVHAEVPAGMDWATFKQKLEDNDKITVRTALWGRARIQGADATGVEGIDRVFLGHTPQAGSPTRLGNCYYIDTGAIFGLLRDENDHFLTLADINANTVQLSVPQPPDESSHIKVVTETPGPVKPFGKYGPSKP